MWYTAHMHTTLLENIARLFCRHLGWAVRDLWALLAFLGASFSAMAGAEAAEAKMVKMFGVRCPLGESCKKGNAWLGNKNTSWFSAERARQAVYDHLVGSPFHKDVDEQLAMEFADTATVESWDVPEEEEVEEEAAAAASSSAPQKRKWQDEEVNYWDPTTRAKRMAVAKAAPKSAGASSGSGAGSGQLANLSHSLEDQIMRQTRNAYIFVKAMTKAENALQAASRLSRQAYQTFQDEAATLRDGIDEMTSAFGLDAEQVRGSNEFRFR
mgnify:FL=1